MVSNHQYWDFWTFDHGQCRIAGNWYCSTTSVKMKRMKDLVIHYEASGHGSQYLHHARPPTRRWSQDRRPPPASPPKNVRKHGQQSPILRLGTFGHGQCRIAGNGYCSTTSVKMKRMKDLVIHYEASGHGSQYLHHARPSTRRWSQDRRPPPASPPKNVKVHGQQSPILRLLNIWPWTMSNSRKWVPQHDFSKNETYRRLGNTLRGVGTR